MAIRTSWSNGDVLTAVDLNDTFDDARENASNLTSGTLPIARIADGAITAAKLGANSVETAKINAGAVTTVKIGDSQVTAAKIADGTITAAKLASAVLSEAWATPTYASGFGDSTQGQGLRYKKIGNILYVAGGVKRTDAGSVGGQFAMATLPAGFRPSAAHMGPASWIAASGKTLDQDWMGYIIETDGVIKMNQPSGGSVAQNEEIHFSAVVVL